MKRWIRRKRNSLGYGVQSPSDFYFVRHVLREKSPYYAYATIEDMYTTHSNQLSHSSIAVRKLLFRLANHICPDTIIEVGMGFSIPAMAMACPSTRCVAITPATTNADTIQSLQTIFPKVEVRCGDEMGLFRQLIHEQRRIDLLHVAHTPYYREVVEAALPHTTERTLMIIEGIRESKEKRAWWKELQVSPSTGISYDLKDIGLLFFDHTRHKNTYWINLRN